MKKFTAILAAMIIALFVVSCGGSSNDPEPTNDNDDPTNPTNDTDPIEDPDEEQDEEPTVDCKIDDAYASSKFDNYYTFKGAGTINDENADDVEMTAMTKTSLYLEHNLDYNLKQSQSYFLNATLTNGWKSIVLIGMGYGGNGYPNVQIQAIVPDQWMNVVDTYKDEYPEVFPDGKAPFAPMINVASIDLHVKGQQIDWYKMCTLAINTYAPTEVSEGDMPEGSFQYCYGKNGTIEPGQTIKFGIDARLTDKFEDIQAAYNVDEEGNPLEEGDEGYLASPEELCTCISYASGSGKEIECPTDEEPAIECKEEEHKQLNEAKDACVCMTGYEEKEGKCEEKAQAPECKEEDHKKLNEAGTACECMTGYEEKEGKCEEKAQAPECKEEDHKKLNEAGTACECVANFHEKDGACVADAVCDETKNEVLNEAKDGCDCKANFHKKDDACVADAVCNAENHEVLNEAKDGCDCMANFHEKDDACVADVVCNAEEHRVADENKDNCVCDADYTEDEGVCKKICAGDEDCGGLPGSCVTGFCAAE